MPFSMQSFPDERSRHYYAKAPGDEAECKDERHLNTYNKKRHSYITTSARMVLSCCICMVTSFLSSAVMVMGLNATPNKVKLTLPVPVSGTIKWEVNINTS